MLQPPSISLCSRTMEDPNSWPMASKLENETVSHQPRTAPPALNQGHPVILDFSSETDPKDPKNWPPSQKITNTILYGLLTMGATLASAIYAAGAQAIASEFHIHADIAALGTSVLLLGFGLGPLLWAPLSEIFGRRLPVLVPCSLSVVFTIGTGFSTNITAVLITRFLTGFCGSAPIAITGGALADMFVPEERAVALLGYAGAVVGGPVLGMNSRPHCAILRNKMLNISI